MRMNGENLVINGNLFEVILEILWFYFATLRLCGRKILVSRKGAKFAKKKTKLLTFCYF